MTRKEWQEQQLMLTNVRRWRDSKKLDKEEVTPSFELPKFKKLSEIETKLGKVWMTEKA